MAKKTRAWRRYLMGFAQHAATKSKDSTQVGCAIIGPNDNVRATGFNGLPRGVKDLPDRMQRPAKYLWTRHAEENAVAHAARDGGGTDGCTAYVTHFPCSRCAGLLIQAGIVEVVVHAGGKTSMPDEEFVSAAEQFEESGVTVVMYTEEVDDGHGEAGRRGSGGTGVRGCEGRDPDRVGGAVPDPGREPGVLRVARVRCYVPEPEEAQESPRPRKGSQGRQQRDRQRSS